MSKKELSREIKGLSDEYIQTREAARYALERKHKTKDNKNKEEEAIYFGEL